LVTDKGYHSPAVVERVKSYEVRFHARSLTEDGQLWMRVLAAHVPDHYGHAMRRFGLLAPRTQRATSAALFLLLG
jgi:hypothetical protein